MKIPKSIVVHLKNRINALFFWSQLQRIETCETVKAVSCVSPNGLNKES